MKLTAPKAWVTATALATALIAAAGPAAAVQLDTDHPRITASNIDFGYHWTISAPRDGGDLFWDVTNGVVTPDLQGYVYLKNAANDCGWIQMVHLDANGNVLARKDSPTFKPGNTDKKRQFFVDLNNYGSAYTTRIMLHLNLDHGCNGTYTTEGTKSFNLGDPD